MDGELKKHKKGDGAGVMVSALCCEERGFGMKLSDAEIEAMNNDPGGNRRTRSYKFVIEHQLQASLLD